MLLHASADNSERKCSIVRNFYLPIETFNDNSRNLSDSKLMNIIFILGTNTLHLLRAQTNLK